MQREHLRASILVLQRTVNTSAYVIYIPESRKVFITNQVRFDETSSSIVNNQQWTNMQQILSETHLISWVKIRRRNGNL
jgi:hypothetical protein